MDKLKGSTLRWAGIAAIIAAVALVIIGNSMYQGGAETYLLESMERGSSAMKTGNMFKYIGYGSGAIGIAALIGGIVKKDTEDTSKNFEADRS